jgi:large subunit ribosomal protein L29
MKSTNLKELREKSVEELQAALLEAQADLYTARKDLVFRRLTDTASMKVRRHNIARIHTVMTEKNKEVNA